MMTTEKQTDQTTTTMKRHLHQEKCFSQRRNRLHRFEQRTAAFARRWFGRQTARWYSAVWPSCPRAGRPGPYPWQQSRWDPRTTDRFETCPCRDQGRTVRWRPECGSVCMIRSVARCSELTAHSNNIHNKYSLSILTAIFQVNLVVSEMTYTVSSGTLNSSIPYHTRWTWVSRCLLKQRMMEVVVTTGRLEL